MMSSSACAVCAHLFKERSGCKAFPKGIPDAIVMGDVTHEKPYPGDHGVQWAPSTEFDAAFVEEYMVRVRKEAKGAKGKRPKKY